MVVGGGLDDYADEAALTPQSASLMQRLDEYEEAAPPPTSPSERHLLHSSPLFCVVNHRGTPR